MSNQPKTQEEVNALLTQLKEAVASGAISTSQIKAATKKPDQFMSASSGLSKIKDQMTKEVDWSTAKVPAARITFVVDFLNDEPQCTSFSIEVLEAQAGNLLVGKEADTGDRVTVPAAFKHPDYPGKFASRAAFLHSRDQRVTTHLIYQQGEASNLEKVPANQKDFNEAKKALEKHNAEVNKTK